ncbi:MAG: helix-turn-helix domain-containing protein [Lachnospiraceae bacterium]|nr:helix-turn-helix domain-containing protein [Lachnospiraceae bacterium]
MKTDLKVWLTLFSRATGICTSVFRDRELLFQTDERQWDYNLPMYLASSLPDVIPEIWYSQSPEGLYFGGVSIPWEGEDSRNLLFLGPVLLDTCTRKQARSLMVRLGHPEPDADIFVMHAERHPHISVSSLIAYLQLICASITGNGFPEVPNLPFRWNEFFPAKREPLREIEKERTPGEGLDLQILSLLDHGKVRELQLFFNEAPIYHLPEVEEATRDFELRRAYMLGANMVASRRAMDAGVDPAVANLISDSVITQLLQARSLHELAPVFQDFMLDYTREVEKVSAFPYADDICCEISRYVITHIYDRLSTSVIADGVHLTPSYISKRFREVTGETITDYIAEQKIREAAYLLDSGQYSPGEISTLLQFSSQSYFIKVFRAQKGMTPQEYRKRKK